MNLFKDFAKEFGFTYKIIMKKHCKLANDPSTQVSLRNKILKEFGEKFEEIKNAESDDDYFVCRAVGKRGPIGL